MRTNGASASFRSPKVIAMAEFVLALPFVTSCAYPIASNSPHLVGRRVDAMRLAGPVSTRLPMRLRRTLPWLRNGPARAQSIDLGRIESQLLENLRVVLTDVGGSHCRHLDDAMHLDRAADRGRQLAAGAFERNDDVVRAQLRIFDHLLRRAHGAESDVDTAEDLVPVRHRLCAEHFVEDACQLRHEIG